MNSCVVEASGLVAGYRRGDPVLRGVSIRLEPGLNAIVGPNGGGKTTLLRVLAGVLRPWSGEARICGYPAGSVEARRLTGYLPPQGGEDPLIRSIDAVVAGRYGVSRGLHWSREDWEASWSALERLGVKGLAHRRLGELSSGQRRLILLASVLARNPRVLLLDEPFEPLDLRNRRLLALLLKNLANQGVVVAFTLHDPLLLAMADKAFLLSDGRIRELESPMDAARALREAYGVPVELVEAGGRLVPLPLTWL